MDMSIFSCNNQVKESSENQDYRRASFSFIVLLRQTILVAKDKFSSFIHF